MKFRIFLNESEIYDNSEGETATVSKQGKGYYVTISGMSDYDMDFKNKTELKKWLKREKFTLVGHE